MTENGGGKERKINCGTATANHAIDGWKKVTNESERGMR
jgi:hypothetical protein